MILCLDAGNSRLKWGLCHLKQWHGQGTIEYAELDALPNLLPASPTRVIACNVAGEAVRKRLEQLATRLATPTTWLTSTAKCCGVSNGYEQPGQLGADRWAALIGARTLHGGAAVVVMAGTATTIDQLDADGTFRGGLILPGLALMHAALARNTADLPLAQGRFLNAPRNTGDAITSGALHATLGAIERMRAALGENPAVLLSGGAAAELSPHIAEPRQILDNLVLEGLARFAFYGSAD
jgi:type III pantothenate kinase